MDFMRLLSSCLDSHLAQNMYSDTLTWNKADQVLRKEKATATHSSTLAWKIPRTEEPGRCSPLGREESDTTERLPFHFSFSCIGEGNGNPLRCSCLENLRDWGAWWAAVYGVAQGWTRLKWLSSSSTAKKITALTWVVIYLWPCQACHPCWLIPQVTIQKSMRTTLGTPGRERCQGASSILCTSGLGTPANHAPFRSLLFITAVNCLLSKEGT